MPDTRSTPLPRQRRYSQAFREPVLTVKPARTDRSAPSPEAFYFEKQMQLQTPLSVVLEDGEHLEGVLEWYDATSLKLRRADGSRVMVYKLAIKYLHKANGAALAE